MIYQVFEKKEKLKTSREILEALPEWFGIEESREEYISDSAGQVFFVAEEAEKKLGFLCLKETGKSTVELTVIGVLQAYHRKGIGKQLFQAALVYAKSKGYDFIQVKTVAMGQYDIYDNTNRFYQSLGFKEFEIFPTLWDEKNPCQIYIMSIGEIGKCGFYCGSCPTYLEGNCLGCVAEHKDGDCFSRDCVQKKSINFCGECKEFPCDKIIKGSHVTVLDKDWLLWKKRLKEEGF